MAFCALNTGICYGRRVKLNRANRVIIAGDHEIHAFRVAVRVHHPNDRNFEIVGFCHGNPLMLDINHEQRIR